MLANPMFIHRDTENYILDSLTRIYARSTKTELLRWLVTPPERTYLRVNVTQTTREGLVAKIQEITSSAIVVEVHDLLEDVIVV